MPLQELIQSLIANGRLGDAANFLAYQTRDSNADSSNQDQGYKLHVSASAANFDAVLTSVIQFLIERHDGDNLGWKVMRLPLIQGDFEPQPAQPNEERDTQRGKFITIYPRTREQALELALELAPLLPNDQPDAAHVPVIGDQQVFEGKGLYVRFAVFSEMTRGAKGRPGVKRTKVFNPDDPTVREDDDRKRPWPSFLLHEKERFKNQAKRLLLTRGRGTVSAPSASSTSSTHTAPARDPVEELVERFDIDRFNELILLSDPDSNDEPTLDRVKLGRPASTAELDSLRNLVMGFRTPDNVRTATAYFRDAHRIAEQAERVDPRREEERRRVAPPE